MLVQQLPILDLSLFDQRNSNTICIVDNSTYSSIPISANLAMQITPPGGNTINVPFTPSNINIYKCVDLGITCSDSSCTPLPDGIYDVNYSVILGGGQPNATLNVKFIKIDGIKCKYEKAFLKLNVEYSCHDHTGDKYLNELKRIKLYIDGCVAAVNSNNYVLSFQLYQKALLGLNNLGCKFKSLNFQSNCNTGTGWGYGSGLIGCCK